MEVAVFQGHRHICLLPQRCELLESNLLDFLSIEQMLRDPGVRGCSCDHRLVTLRI